jgi:hypothetical protein
MEEVLAAFQQLAGSGRVGTPVFLRCLVTCRPDLVPEALDRAIHGAVAVLGDRPRTLYARGDLAAVNLHVLLDFPSGASALIIVAPGEPACDATLLGNHGAAYLEGSLRSQLAVGGWQLAGKASDSSNAERPTPAPTATRQLPTANYLPLVQRSLSEGRPVPIEEASDA